MKALVGAFNQEKALVGAFSVIVKTGVEPMDRFAALLKTTTMIPSPASEDCLASGIIQCQMCIRWSAEDAQTILQLYVTENSHSIQR